ncbi:MAG: SpoIVB peptidase S55 domain-containing protein [Planctomycetota bacterium]
MKKSFHAFVLFIIAVSAVLSAQQPTEPDLLDSSKYIPIDEIKPGMKAYCLTIYEGTKIEKFELEVLSVVRDFRPGMDAILVKGLDERFIQTGPVGGCSGSPVYIEGRMAGALAYGWTFSKDPLYGVTPIKDMLRVGQNFDNQQNLNQNTEEPRLAFDYSTPISFKGIHQMLSESFLERKSYYGSMEPLPCPLVITGASAQACEIIGPEIENLGLMAVAGIGAGSKSKEVSSQQSIQLAPGACLAIPLVSGDISMNIVGTVTEIQDKKVYGFGHSYLGYGPVNLPMATGKVHTVVSSLSRSFKLASAEKIVGTLRMDESTGVLGNIGEEPKMIPLRMAVERYNDADKRVYNCQIVNNKRLTPNMLSLSLNASAFMLGPLPPYNSFEYNAKISLKNQEDIKFENISANTGPMEMTSEAASALALLMNNPYEEVSIESLDFDIRITDKNIVSHIWSVNLSDTSLRVGEKLDVSIVIESFLEGKKTYDCMFEIPENLEPGKYQLLIAGAKDYEAFLRQYSSYKFIAENFDSLTEALNHLLNINRDRLYCILVLRPDGVTMQKAELPDLPDTKVLILQSPKRTLQAQPYMHWLEKSFNTGTIVIDKQTMNIIVEE